MEFVFTRSAAAAVYWLATAAWILEIAARRSRRATRRPRQIWSFGLLAALVCGSLAVTGLLYHLRIGRVEGGGATALRWAGLTIYAGGVLLRVWAAAALGAWFSRHIQVEPGQALVSHGPYRRLRHPLYLGLVLAAIGLNLVMATLPGVAAATLVLVPAVLGRMREEERILEAALGERYRVWTSARYRLLPFVY